MNFVGPPRPAIARLSPERGSPYQGYLYSYPHKTAYRELDPPTSLAEAWDAEPRDGLFLYLHVPFCEMRCGFCNLFTVTDAKGSMAEPILAAMERQAATMAGLLGERRFARMAVGGGTPTLLSPADLERLFAISRRLGLEAGGAPTSVEASPGTATPDRLAVLKAHGVSRLSLGVESFFADDLKAMGRPQREGLAELALDAIRQAGFSVLNIDLIYGAEGQDPARFLRSLEVALRYCPEEIYLYPLYVRPLTGLGKTAAPASPEAFDAERLAAYRAGRDYLLSAGYRQISMRMFARAGHDPDGGADGAPAYRCDADAMLGIGPGARSYTSRLHYSSRYAVGRAALLSILKDFAERDARDFAYADYGVRLDEAEIARRAVILGLLQAEGLDLASHYERFPGHAEALAGLAVLEEAGLAERIGQRLRLTTAGLERADAIGPWLISTTVADRMEAYAWEA